MKSVEETETATQVTEKPEAVDPKTMIVVLDRGYVYVGKVTRKNDHLTITDAQNIRRWGTTNGLGQLALSGKQPNTVLDPAGTVLVPLRAVIHSLLCNPEHWQ